MCDVAFCRLVTLDGNSEAERRVVDGWSAVVTHDATGQAVSDLIV